MHVHLPNLGSSCSMITLFLNQTGQCSSFLVEKICGSCVISLQSDMADFLLDEFNKAVFVEKQSVDSYL